MVYVWGKKIILTVLVINGCYFPSRLLHCDGRYITNSPQNLRVHNKKRWWDSVFP